MEVDILDLKKSVKYARDKFIELYQTKPKDKETLYAALMLITLASEKMSLYNKNPLEDDENLYRELCDMAAYTKGYNRQNFYSVAIDSLTQGSISILRYVVAQKFLGNENDICYSGCQSLTELVKEVRENFVNKNISYFEKYFMPLNVDFLVYINNYSKTYAFNNWGALYRHLLPFVYDYDLKLSVWYALEVLRDNLLCDLNLEQDWECLNSQGWHNHVRSYYGFEGPSNYGSQRAVLMLHPKKIPDHKNSAQLVCYFHDNVADFGLDIGVNIKNKPETKDYSNWEHIFPSFHISYDEAGMAELYNKMRDFMYEKINLALELNNKIIENNPEIEKGAMVDGDADYSDESEVNLFDKDTRDSGAIAKTQTSNNGGDNGSKPPVSTSQFDDENDEQPKNENNSNNETDISKIYPNIKYYEDYFNYAKYAETITNQILANRNIEPMNIALYGDWGSGKTQIINFIKDYLAKINQDLDDENYKDRNLYKKTVIIDFDAWQYNAQECIWASLALKFLAKSRNIHWWSDLYAVFWRMRQFFRNNYKIIILKYLFVILIYFFIFYIDGLFISDELLLKLWTLDFSQLSALALAIVLLPELFKPVFANIEISFAKLFKSDDCKEKLGFNHQVKEHVKFALKHLCQDGQTRVILFVDNLDRCSSSNVKQILDSISKFIDIVNEDKYSNIKYEPIRQLDSEQTDPENNEIELFTVFAMDKNVIIEALEKENVPQNKVENYLEKIVHCSLIVEKPKDIKDFIKRFLGKSWNKEKEFITNLYHISKFVPRRLANFRYIQHVLLKTYDRNLSEDEIKKILITNSEDIEIADNIKN